MQWARSGRFQLYDFGSAAANRAHYGSAEPPDIAANYGRLDIPVDIMAGEGPCQNCFNLFFLLIPGTCWPPHKWSQLICAKCLSISFMMSTRPCRGQRRCGLLSDELQRSEHVHDSLQGGRMV